jgi:putative nucleotidyltransferase with HDIG domain
MKAEALIAQTADLPPPSPSVVKLLGLLNRPDTDSDEVVQVVRHDGVLSAKLLSLCNSALYGFAEPVGSIEQAVLCLGYQEVYRLVLAVSFGGSLSRKLSGYMIEEQELWRHSLLTALATECALADGCPVGVEPSIAYTAGLIHDIGKLVLNHALRPDLQSAVRGLIQQAGRSRIEAERAVLDTDHAEVGATLLQQWRLPEVLVEAVAHHHQPVLAPKPRLSALVHLGNCIAHELGSAPGLDGYALRAEEKAVEALGIGSQKFERILIAAHDTLHRIEQMIAAA